MPPALKDFKGPNAIRNFPDPGRQPDLPLVEIPNALNPFARDRVRIFAKLERQVSSSLGMSSTRLHGRVW